MSDLYPNSYQTPNALIDRLLSSGDIDPYEFTLLSVIIRKTRGWHKEEDFISLQQFSELIPAMSYSTIRRKLNDLEEKQLISVTRNTLKSSKIASSYKLGPAFYKPVQADQATVTENVATSTENAASTVTESKATVRKNKATVKENAGPTVTENNTKLISLNSLQQNSTVAADFEKSDGAAIAALKQIGCDPAQAAVIVTRCGPDRVLREIDRCEFAATFPGFIKSSKIRWVMGSLDTPTGFSVPDGYISPEERAEAEQSRAEREKALAKRQAIEQAEEARRDAERRHWKSVWDKLPKAEQDRISAAAIDSYEAMNDFCANMVRRWRSQGETDLLIASRHVWVTDIRNAILQEEMDSGEPDAANAAHR